MDTPKQDQTPGFGMRSFVFILKTIFYLAVFDIMAFAFLHYGVNLEPFRYAGF